MFLEPGGKGLCGLFVDYKWAINIGRNLDNQFDQCASNFHEDAFIVRNCPQMKCLLERMMISQPSARLLATFVCVLLVVDKLNLSHT